MKKILMSLMFVLSVSVLAFAEDNIAVFPFENKAGNDYGLTELAENEMTSLLVNQKRFTVIERKDLNKILQEQHLSNSGIVDINQALKIGKIKGIRYGVFGETNSVSWSEKNVASAALQIKVVDMETANVMFSKVYNIQEQQNKNADKKAAFASMLKAKFKKDIANDLINAFAVEGSIIDIKGKRVTIDAGRKNGVVRGMEFNVIERTEKTSSRTGEKIVVDTPVALLEVTDVVSDNSSICKFKQGEKIKEGMFVKQVQIDDRYYKAEDIEKMLIKRGIKAGDLAIYGYFGMGIAESVKDDPWGASNEDSKNSILWGAKVLYYLNSYLGLGIDFYMTDRSDKDSYDKEGSGLKLGYSNYSFKTNVISLAGRVNLNKSSNIRAFIPFAVGISNFEHRCRHAYQIGSNTYVERETKSESAYSGNLGFGLEWDFANNFSVGVEGKYNIIKLEKSNLNFVSVAVELGYRFGLF